MRENNSTVSEPLVVMLDPGAVDKLCRAGVEAVAITGSGASQIEGVTATPRPLALWRQQIDDSQLFDQVVVRLNAHGADVRLVDDSTLVGFAGCVDRLLATHRGADTARSLVRQARPLSGSIDQPPRAGPAERLQAGYTCVSLADVRPESVEWLWHDHFPRGALVILDGDPDRGKSTLTLDVAARVTTGRAMPDGTCGGPPASVLILSAEDSLPRTVLPRLKAAEADVRRVRAFSVRDALGERLASLPEDIPHIEAAIREFGAALLIVDPLMAFLSSTVNSHNDHDVRRALGPLASMAARTGACVLLVRHLNKSGGSHAVYRGGGSIGVIGTARAAFLVAADPDDGGRRILVPTKCNLAPMPRAMAFRMIEVPELHVARMAWEGTTDHTAADLLALPSTHDRTAVQEAADFLRELLATGPVPAAEVPAHTRAAGFSWPTVLRAKKVAGVRPRKVGQPGQDGQYWVWQLIEAEDAPTLLEGAHP